MSTIEPYLHFNGNCEDALTFYVHAFKGEVTLISRYREGPMPVPEDWKSKIMHATIVAGSLKFMVSDGTPDHPVTHGSSVQLSVNTTDLAEQKRQWDALSVGATIKMPLEDTFWGARFGMLTDKFGINWMFNCELPKKVS